MMMMLVMLGLVVLKVSGLECPSCKSDEYCYNFKCLKETCVGYTERLGSTDLSKQPFSTQVSLDSNKNVIVSTSFKDVQTDGTMKLDNANSCITHQLFRYGPQFLKLSSEKEIVVNSRYDEQNSTRIWEFKIGFEEVPLKLYGNTTDDYIVYYGYYAYKFYVADILQVTYQITFQIKIDNKVSNSKTLVVEAEAQSGKLTCKDYPNNLNCVDSPSSVLYYCQESTCMDPQNAMNITQGIDFWIMQEITEKGFDKWLVQDGSVYIHGEDFYEKVPVVLTSLEFGKTIYRCNIQRDLSSLSLTVSSVMMPSALRRQLTSTNGQGKSVTAAEFICPPEQCSSNKLLVGIILIIMVIIGL